jgi:hypothetical protein
MDKNYIINKEKMDSLEKWDFDKFFISYNDEKLGIKSK